MGNRRYPIREKLEMLEAFSRFNPDRSRKLLLCWLNSNEGGGVMGLMITMMQVNKMIQETPQTDDLHLAEQLSTIFQFLYKLLGEYNYGIYCVPTFGKPPWWIGLEFHSKNEVRVSFESGEINQGDALISMLWMAHAGLLEKFKICEQCDTWFFARRKVDETCGKTCSKRRIHASEEYRRRKREYMRAWRAVTEKIKENELKRARRALNTSKRSFKAPR